MSKIDSRFWREVEKACLRRGIHSSEIRKWITSMVENLGERMLAYWVSDLTPSVDRQLIMDIFILVKDRVHGFSIKKNSREYHVHLPKSYTAMGEEITKNEVIVKFFMLGHEGFFIADKPERLDDVREFMRSFSKIAWG